MTSTQDSGPGGGPATALRTPPSEGRQFRRYGEREDRKRSLSAKVFSLLAVVAALAYLAFLPLGMNWDVPVVSSIFIAAEVVCLVVFVLGSVNVWNLRFKPGDGLSQTEFRSVDVFVTVCEEPMDVVDRSLTSVALLEWPGKLNIYVLDDGGSAEVEERASALGYHYLSRPKEGLSREHQKAGNLNFGLERTDGDLVFTLDADHKVRADALVRMGGYMRFERVAFVQSKQAFEVPTGDPFNSMDPVFYDAVQLGMDAVDSVISCGSGVLYRREALEEIGGFAEWNLVEDLTTSYELHSHGWKSLYFPYAVTLGLAPMTIGQVYQQRMQWAVDTMRIFIWDNPLFKSGLNLAGRLNHLVIGLSYVWAGFFLPIFFLVPPYTYLTGVPILVDYELVIILIRFVYFVLFAFAAELLFRGQKPGKQFQFLAGLFPVYVAGAVRALFHPPGKSPAYRVNNVSSEARRTRRWPGWFALLPQMLLLAANTLLPFFAIYRVPMPAWVLAGNFVVSAFAIWTLWPVVHQGLTHLRVTPVEEA